MVLVIFVAVCPLTPAQAEVAAKVFIRNYGAANLATQKVMRETLEWVASGIGWANTDLHSMHQQRLYCQPGKLALTGEQLEDMLERHVQEELFAADYPFGLVLLESLKKVFPCPPQ
jgi:hypothetical protein